MECTTVKFLAILVMINGLQCHAANILKMDDKCTAAANRCFLNNRDESTAFLDYNAMIRNVSYNTEQLVHTEFFESVCSTVDWLKSCVNDDSCDASIRFELFPANVYCEHREDVLDSPGCWKSDGFTHLNEDCRNGSWPDDCSGLIQMMDCEIRKSKLIPECSERNKYLIEVILIEYLTESHSKLCR